MSDIPDISDDDIDATLDADTLDRLRCMSPIEQQGVRDAIRRDMRVDAVMAQCHANALDDYSTHGDRPVAQVLAEVADLTSVVVMGYDAAGQFCMVSSLGDDTITLMLIERAREQVAEWIRAYDEQGGA